MHSVPWDVTLPSLDISHTFVFTSQSRRREAGRRVRERTATQQDADGVFRATGGESGSASLCTDALPEFSGSAVLYSTALPEFSG